MGTEMFFMKFDGNITESGQEDKLNSEKCGAGGPLGKTLGYRPRNRCIGRQFIGRRTLELMVETVEAGGNDVINPFNRRRRDMFCSSDISGGYRVLLIMNPTYSWG